MQEVLVFIQLIGVIIGFVNLMVVGVQKSSENQKFLLSASACAFISIIAYYFELRAVSLSEAVLAVKFGYIGKCFVLVLLVVFINNFCNVNMSKFIFKGLFAFSTVMLLLILTCDYHNFYYSKIEFITTENGFTHIIFEKGLGYYMFMTVTIVLLFYFAILTFLQCVKRKKYERKRLLLLSIAAILPTMMLLLYLTGIFSDFDPTPLGIVLSCSLLTVNVLNYGLLDTMQIARKEVFENTRESLIIVDPGYNLIYMNEMAKKIFSKLSENIPESELISWIFDEHKEESVLNIDNKNYEIRISKLTEDASLKGYIAWIFDMSFINEYTDEMISLKQEAERANRAKTVFLARMSHEIRTPMNAIMGFSSLALKNNNVGQMKEQLKHIYNSAHSLLNIINDILDISKIESGKLELVVQDYSTKQLFSEVISIIQSQVKRETVEFIYHIPPEIPKILAGDSTRIREVMINLLNNAVKYTQKGFIQLDVSIESMDETECMLCLHIKDTGKGIRKEDCDKVFEIFERVDVKANFGIEGSGLGLAIVKEFVSLMDGTIDFQSEYNKGTEFHVHLKQKIVDASPLGEFKDCTKQRMEMSNLKLQNCRALVVDDNQMNLLVEKELLQQYGVVADTVLSGFDALKAIRQCHYDIIFVDHMMPEMDGVETLKCMKKEKEFIQNTKIVALTANAVRGVREELLAEGFDEFLSKPIINYELEELLYSAFSSKLQMKKDAIASDSPDNMQEELAHMGVSIQNGLQYCNSMPVYKEVLNLAVEMFPDKRNKLVQYYNEKNYPAYLIEIHSLKSSMRHMGADELGDFAERQELAIKNQETDYLLETFEQIITDYTELIQSLVQFLLVHQMLNVYNELKKCLEFSQKGDMEPVQGRMKQLIGKLEGAKLSERLELCLKMSYAYDITHLGKELQDIMNQIEENGIN